MALEGRCDFCYSDGSAGYFVGKLRAYGADYTACHVLQESRRDVHLALDALVDFGIVDGVLKAVALERLGNVAGEGDANLEVVAHYAFLLSHTMVGEKSHLIERN